MTVGIFSKEDGGAWFYPEGLPAYFVHAKDLDKFVCFSPGDAETIAKELERAKQKEIEL